MNLNTISDFLEPINIYELSDDQGYKKRQMGHHISFFGETIPNVEDADLVLIGCGEMRGEGPGNNASTAPDRIRKEFYKLFHWHADVIVADLGNIKTGKTIQDSYAALSLVIKELLEGGKRVVILGGSHDLLSAQYKAYASFKKDIELVNIDARIDMNNDSRLPAEKFLLDLLTEDSSYIKQYNHIGFQSYMIHPQMLEALDQLRFDCFRVGKVKENLEAMEPLIRNSDLFSFDICAIEYAHAPANRLTPNGFTGEDACSLMQYAGMSSSVNSVGLYGYNPVLDQHNMTAIQLSHMLWYYMDGIHQGKLEASFDDKKAFNEFTLAFAEVKTTFLQSKRTDRWWMRLPDGYYFPCTAYDYHQAANNEIPERWLRAIERL